MENIISKALKDFKLSQEELGKLIDVSREYINKMENGKKPISHRTQAHIAELYKKSEVNNSSHTENNEMHEDRIDLEKKSEIINETVQENINALTIRDLAKSGLTLSEATKVIADTAKTLADNNKSLIDILKESKPNSRSGEDAPQHISEIITPYLIRMANAGVIDKAWNSVDEGLVKLGKWLISDFAVMQV